MPSAIDPTGNSDRDSSGDSNATGAGARWRRRLHGRGVAGAIVVSLFALVLVSTSVFLIWTQDTFVANSQELSAIEADSSIRLEVDDRAAVIGPAGEGNGQGLVFFPGAKIEPAAYVATFAEMAVSGTTIVIAEVPLNLALLETRTFGDIIDLVPEVSSWAVGGHSMGGVKACNYADTEDVDALILLASYCSGVDLTGRTDLPVLTVVGSRDGVINIDSLLDSREMLPSGAQNITITGANHSQIGDYGIQPGDTKPTASDEVVRSSISNAVMTILGSVER